MRAVLNVCVYYIYNNDDDLLQTHGPYRKHSK